MSRLDELYERQLDGELMPAEQDEFGLLLADPAQQRQLARLLALHGALARATAWRPADERPAMPPLEAAPGPAASSAGLLRLRPFARRGVRWAAAGVLCLAAVALMAWPRGRAPAARSWTLAAAGGATTLVQDERELPASAGVALAAGDRLRGAAILQLADGSRLESGRDTLLEALGGRPGVRLLNGRVTVTATARPHGPPLAVETQFGTVEVRGTRYQVVADALGTVVTVSAGTVALLHGGDPPLLVSAGSGASATATAATRFALPSAPWTVDFAAAGADWSGQPMGGGRTPLFHHRDQQAGAPAIWGVVSPLASGSGYVALGQGLAAQLVYDLPQPCDAFILLTIASAADPHDFRANLQADVHLTAGTGQQLHLAPARFTLRTGEVPLARGDEVVVQAYIMVMGGDHQLVVRRFALAPAPP